MQTNPSRHSLRVHHLVGVELASDFPWVDRWQELIADVHQISEASPPPQQTLRVHYTEKLSSDGMRALGDDWFMASGKLLDKKYGILLERNEDGGIALTVDNPCLEWMLWGIQLCLLQAGCTFVHAAGIAREGQAVLIPSWGRVGKTVMVSKLVRNNDWTLLGDDLVILSPDDTCYGYPKSVVVYPFHRHVFPELFQEGGGPVAPSLFNSTVYSFAKMVKLALRPFPRLFDLARQHNPQATRVNPSQIFGMEKLATSAQLCHVLWLDRVPDLHEPTLVPADATLVGRIMGSTMTDAFYERCVESSYYAAGAGILPIDTLFQHWTTTLQTTTSPLKNYLLHIPEAMPADELPDLVDRVLREKVLRG